MERVYPWRQVNFSFLSYKFQYTSMCRSLLGSVDEFEVHGVFDMQSGELLKCGGWQADLAAEVDMITIRALKHQGWVNSIMLIKSSGSATSTVLHHSHECLWILAFEVLCIELGKLVSIEQVIKASLEGWYHLFVKG